MRRKLAVFGVSLATVLAGTATALAGSSPQPGKDYYSPIPNVSITIGKPANYVMVYASCTISGVVGDNWTSGKIPLRHNAFSYDHKTKIGTDSGGSFGTVTTTVLVTGTFSAGKFTGTMQLAGSSCPKAHFTAKLNKGSGRGGNV